jgi:transposase
VRHGAHLICLDETGFLMMPVLRRTWAPCGATPLVSVGARFHDKVSGIGALVVSPRRRQLTLALALYPRRNIRGPQVLRVLRHLARHVRGRVLLVWDRGRAHKHQIVRAWLAAHPRWHIVWFPPYAPDLNPVELLWSYLKYGRLANFAPDTVDDIRGHVSRERRRLARRPELLRSFFRHSALPFRV